MDKEKNIMKTVTDETLSPVTVFVCTACGLSEDADQLSDGKQLQDELSLLSADIPHIVVMPVDCLAVCERSVTVAFAAPGKWSYVIGDVDLLKDKGDIISVADAIARSPHGVPAMTDRPPFFRKGVVSRTPPPTI